MQMIKDVFKASLWGFSLLILIMLIIFSVVYSSNLFSNFYTEKNITEYKKTYEVILNLSNQSKGLSPNRSPAQFHDEVEKIRKAYLDNCLNCRNFNQYSFEISDPSFAIKIQLDRFIEEVAKFTKKENVDYSNNILIFTIASSVLNIIVCVYLIIGLSKYKILGATGLIALFIIFTPLILTCTSIVTSYDFWNKDIKLESNQFMIIIFSIAYAFIVYPPTIIINRNKGFSLKKILFLQYFR
jgi:ABC-type maltose transport system permease subunit